MDVIRSAFDSWKAGESRTTLVRLLEASQHLIYGVCHEVLRHREDSEDAAQRVLLDIPKGLDRVADAEHFLRRLRVMAFRTALDTRRDRRRRMDRERKAADMHPTAPLPDEVREAIHEAMSALDEDSRSLVIEHYFEKATLDEIGARRGVSAAAVWKRIENVKGRLRDGLALAGLATAASKAEACLEAAALAAPPANLVTASVLANVAAMGGGLMAAKTSTATVATLVALLTFALGLGGGLAIQAARTGPESNKQNLEAQNHSIDSGATSSVSPSKSKIPALSGGEAPPSAVTDSAEDHLRIAREIWAQFSRPRFWKDKEARDEIMPKLDLLGPDQAAFFIEKFRNPNVKHDQKKEAVRLAVTCGGPEASALLLELMCAGDAKEVRDYRLTAQVVLKSESWGGPPEIPFNESLRTAAHALLVSEAGWDRAMARSLLTYGRPADWIPIVTEAAKTDVDGLMRSEAVNLLVKRGGAEALAFLRDNKEAIRTMALDPRYGAGAEQEVERQRDRLGRVVDDAIEKLESQLKK